MVRRWLDHPEVVTGPVRKMAMDELLQAVGPNLEAARQAENWQSLPAGDHKSSTHPRRLWWGGGGDSTPPKSMNCGGEAAAAAAYLPKSRDEREGEAGEAGEAGEGEDVAMAEAHGGDSAGANAREGREP
jgi:hypothetical protein